MKLNSSRKSRFAALCSIAVLPTGFGKSIIFQMIPSVCSKIQLSKNCNPCHRLSVGFSNQLHVLDIVPREGNDS